MPVLRRDLAAGSTWNPTGDSTHLPVDISLHKWTLRLTFSLVRTLHDWYVSSPSLQIFLSQPCLPIVEAPRPSGSGGAGIHPMHPSTCSSKAVRRFRLPVASDRASATLQLIPAIRNISLIGDLYASA